MRTPAFLIVLALTGTAPAAAQTPYVTVSTGVEISRFDHVESAGPPSDPGGEAAILSLRLGAPIGARWGAELGFTRPSEVTSATTFDFPIPLLTAVQALPGIAEGSIGSPLILPRPFGIQTARRNTTLDTVAWVTHAAGSRVDFAYLAGLSFSRIVETVSYTFPARAGIVLPSTRATMYRVGPLVGVEARIGLTDHVMIVPGIRLHGIGGSAEGWLIRAAAGLGWKF